MCDIYVILDDVQFNSRDWQNRAKIISSGSEILLSIPVKKAAQIELIENIEIFDFPYFSKKVKRTVHHAYGRTPHWNWISTYLEQLFSHEHTFLTEFSTLSATLVLETLEIKKQHLLSSHLNIVSENASERLSKICELANGDVYISDSGGSNYLNEQEFKNTRVVWQYWKEPDCRTEDKSYRNLSFLDFVANYGPVNLKKHLLEEQIIMSQKPSYHVK